MVYPLIDFHETLLGCLESANDGRARAFLRTDDTISLGPSQTTPGRRRYRELPSQPIRDSAAFDRYAPSTEQVEARSRRRSMTSPCVCPSARSHLHLERIARPAQKKRPVSRYSPRDRSSFPVDVHGTNEEAQPWYRAGSRRYHVARVPRVVKPSTGSSSLAKIGLIMFRVRHRSSVVAFAIDHRGRQLGHLGVGLVVSDRGVLLAFFILSRSPPLARICGSPSTWLMICGPFVLEAFHRDLSGRYGRGHDRGIVGSAGAGRGPIAAMRGSP